MKVVKTIAEVRRMRGAGAGSWGLVPTMGFLHAGHISLVERARRENDHVGVSIFVNPTQFAPTEDLAAYPRDLERDLRLLREAGADLVWTPPAAEVYPPGFQTYITVEEVTRPLEGAARPTHFRGVATVVAKLFNVFQPDRAYFGQKDAQQAVVIQQMARDLDFPLEVVICPIVREPDGLALSSRNVYLTPEQRAAAPVLEPGAARGAGCLAGGRARRRALAGDHAGRAGRRAAGPSRLRERRPTPSRWLELGDAGRGVLLSMAVRIGQGAVDRQYAAGERVDW